MPASKLMCPCSPSKTDCKPGTRVADSCISFVFASAVNLEMRAGKHATRIFAFTSPKLFPDGGTQRAGLERRRAFVIRCMGFARVLSSVAVNHSSYREFQPLKCTRTRLRCASASTIVALNQSPAQSRAKNGGGFGFQSDRKKMVEATPACKCSGDGDPLLALARAPQFWGRCTLFATGELPGPTRGGTQRLGGARDRSPRRLDPIMPHNY